MDTSPKLKKGGEGGSRKKPVTRSTRAGLQFSIGRVCRYLKKGRYPQRIGTTAPVFLVAVLEFLVAEVLELAGNAARDLDKRKRITPNNIWYALHTDREFQKLFACVTIAQGDFLRKSNIAYLSNNGGILELYY